ncbi:hypothetical protein N310_03030, partial [Acanthisitta chloris]
LAQGHVCEEFDGMCCFNLSIHGQSIQKQLKWLHDHTQKINVIDNPFGQWFSSL